MRNIVRRAVVAVGALAVVLGTGAGVASAAPAPPTLVWSPGSFDFGTLNSPGDTSSQVFTLTNTSGGGSSALTITVAPAGTYSIKAGTDTCTGKSLGQNKSCTVTVIFTAPATVGRYPGTLTATGSKPNVTATASLTGRSGKATPTISTSPQPAAGVPGNIMSDQATVTGGDNPGGTVTFTLYRAAGCPADSQYLTSAFNPLNSNGTAYSVGTEATATGTYYWTATYNGDNNNNSVSTGCDEAVVISTCLAADTTSGQNFTDLPNAVSAANPGDSLNIEGTCAGTTEIGKNLTLTGQPAREFFPTGTLDGGGNGSVLTIDSGVNVTLNTLIITNGSGGGTEGKGTEGGGIYNDGALTVNDSSITGNTASFFGGGIYNYYDGTVTLNNSTVTGNTGGAFGGAGGIFNLGTVTLNNTPVTGNAAVNGGVGGGIFMALGTLTLNNSTIGGSDSNSGNSGYYGGGIYVNGGTVNLNNSSITGNSGYEGGGIFMVSGAVSLNNSSTITGNTASNDGGGVFGQDGTVTLDNTSSITGNNPNDCSGGPIFTGCTG